MAGDTDGSGKGPGQGSKNNPAGEPGGSGAEGGGSGEGSHDHELIGSLRHELPYLDNTDFKDPLNRLGLGAVDEKGASLFGMPQTAHDGYVCALQQDLWDLGFREDRQRGVFDEALRTAVIVFQRHARTSRRDEVPGEVEVTFTGGLTGEADEATRREIKLWKEKGYRRLLPILAEDAAEAIFTFAAREETGRPIPITVEKSFDPELGRETTHPVPRAYHFLENHRREGLRAGLLGWSQRSGWLGRLIRFIYEVDPKILPEFLGPNFIDVYNATNERSQRSRMGVRLTADDAWERLLRHPAVEKVNLYLAWQQILGPVLEVAERCRIRTVKGLTLLADVVWTLGPQEAILAADACGPRDIARSVADHLAPALYTLRTIVPPGKRHLVERYERIVRGEDIDESVEYYWHVRFELARAGRGGPKRH